MNTAKRAGAVFALSMFIMGTVGIFRRWIELPSGVILLFRGVLGAAFIAIFYRARGRHPDLAAIRKDFRMLLLLGALMGCGWVMLFEAYRMIRVGVASLCFYMAPTMVILLSPLILHVRLTLRDLISCLIALAGIVLASGVLTDGIPSKDMSLGILFGLLSAATYALNTLLNKRINTPAAERTIVQLITASCVMLPYEAVTGEYHGAVFTGRAVALLLIVGIVHTGVDYVLYFSSMVNISAQTVALYSYIDPVTSILLSAILLGELPTWGVIAGAALILAAARISRNSK